MGIEKGILAVDIDDVLFQSAAGFAAFSNKRWRSNITALDYHEDWAGVWGVSHKKAIKRARLFHELGVHATYEPIEGARLGLTALRTRFRYIHAVTSRRLAVQGITEESLSRHFAGLIDEVHCIGAWDKDGPEDVHLRLAHTKTEVCQEIGATHLIEDQPKHCVDAARAGITALLFGEYPWNQEQVEMPGLVRVADWAAVREYFSV